MLPLMQIPLSDIDFFTARGNEMIETLKLREREGMYPPRFRVFINCSSSARQSKTEIQFRGTSMNTDMVFDIPLNPLVDKSKCTCIYL